MAQRSAARHMTCSTMLCMTSPHKHRWLLMACTMLCVFLVHCMSCAVFTTAHLGLHYSVCCACRASKCLLH
jgi:hypothetical protein